MSGQHILVDVRRRGFLRVGTLLAVTICIFALAVGEAAKVRAGAIRDAQVQAVVLQAEKVMAGCGVSAARSARAAVAFRRELDQGISGQLSDEQVKTILEGVERGGLGVYCDEPNDLELELALKGLAFGITSYVARKPLSRGEEALLNQQVDTFVSTFRHQLENSLRGDAYLGQALAYVGRFRDTLTGYAQDPISPLLKRPFTNGEMQKLTKWLRDAVDQGAEAFKSEQQTALGVPPWPGQAVVGALNGFPVQCARCEFPPVRLSEEKMAQMHAERKLLLTRRAKEFDQLTDAEKEERMRKERGR